MPKIGAHWRILCLHSSFVHFHSSSPLLKRSCLFQKCARSCPEQNYTAEIIARYLGVLTLFQKKRPPQLRKAHEWAKQVWWTFLLDIFMKVWRASAHGASSGNSGAVGSWGRDESSSSGPLLQPDWSTCKNNAAICYSRPPQPLAQPLQLVCYSGEGSCQKGGVGENHNEEQPSIFCWDETSFYTRHKQDATLRLVQKGDVS